MVDKLVIKKFSKERIELRIENSNGRGARYYILDPKEMIDTITKMLTTMEESRIKKEIKNGSK